MSVLSNVSVLKKREAEYRKCWPKEWQIKWIQLNLFRKKKPVRKKGSKRELRPVPCGVCGGEGALCMPCFPQAHGFLRRPLLSDLNVNIVALKFKPASSSNLIFKNNFFHNPVLRDFYGYLWQKAFFSYPLFNLLFCTWYKIQKMQKFQSKVSLSLLSPSHSLTLLEATLLPI